MEAPNSGSRGGIPLYVHTLETLCKELISGRSVTDDDDKEFKLKSDESRTILNWYWKNKSKWNQRNRKEDVEAIVDELKKTAPTFPNSQMADVSKGTRRLYLKSMRAHRFGGIHRYGTPDEAPDDFEHQFNRGLTAIEGANGAGKTSLLNAICWCLSGFIYRSQRQPEDTEQKVIVSTLGNDDRDDESSTFDVNAITPIPPGEVLKSLKSGEHVPLDTSVELLFEDAAGTEIGPVKRVLTRTARGKPSIIVENFEKLELDPIALEIGTKMTGLIPYIQLGTPCDIGKAVAAITGLKPLEDLVLHAKKSIEKLRGEMRKKRETAIESEDDVFLGICEETGRLLTEHADIKPKAKLPEPGNNARVKNRIERLKSYFRLRQKKMLENAQEFLGDSYDNSDEEQRKDLITNVGPAKGLLDGNHLKTLDSARRLNKLGQIDDEELSKAESLIAKIEREARELYELSQKPDIANRMRLYARVAGWIRGQDAKNIDTQNCPVCRSDLEGKIDRITGKAVREHIQETVQKDAPHIEKTIPIWEQEAIKEIRSSFPQALASEIGRTLPADPTDLIQTALVDELFQHPAFGKSLTPLKETSRSLCEMAASEFSQFEEPDTVELPGCFEDNEGGLREAIGRVRRAIAFSRWRRKNTAECAKMFRKVIGTPEETQYADGQPLPLRKRLDELEKLVRNVEPTNTALSHLDKMEASRQRRVAQEDRVKLYDHASHAMEELLCLNALVDHQVRALMAKLSSDTQKWERRFYRAPFSDAPTVVGTDVGNGGTLLVQAETQGTLTEAHHISNASHLRATLLAFLIAFWEHLLRNRGGIALLLFDDLPELFDYHNKNRVANSLWQMVEIGGQVAVTTNDHYFGRNGTLRAERELDIARVERRCLHPLTASREHIGLGYFVEEVERKKDDFEKKKEDHQAAREYMRYLRIYVENRLLDLLDVSDSKLTQTTLMPIIDAIRTRVTQGMEPFTERVFRNLVDAPELRPDNSFSELMNKSHHGKEGEITYGEVYSIRSECVKIRTLVEHAWEAYERWLRRDAKEDSMGAKELQLAAMEPPQSRIPIIENLAAFSHEAGQGEALETGEQFDFEESLKNHAVYKICTHNFGFAGRIYCRAIVKLSEDEVPDNSLAIALHGKRTYARRIFRDRNRPGMVALCSDAANPVQRPPSLLLPLNEVTLRQVIGIIFDDSKPVAKTREETFLAEDGWGDLGKTEILFRDVRGDSAIPFALPGQMILGGKQIQPTEFDEYRGYAVAVASEGRGGGGAMLKRVGEALDGAPYIRQFESIGGLGDSLLAKTESIQGVLDDLPLVLSARLVLGVIYEL